MKKILILALAGATLYACRNERTVRQMKGRIVNASMHVLVIKPETGDTTYTFSTVDADMAQADGLLLGAPVTVDYRGALQRITPAVKVVTDPAYEQAVGRWTRPDPLAPDSARVGIELMVEGKAASIRMATLEYQSWELGSRANEIILRGKSIGNGQTLNFTERATLGEEDGKPCLAIDGTNVVYVKEGLPR